MNRKPQPPNELWGIWDTADGCWISARDGQNEPFAAYTRGHAEEYLKEEEQE